jgi:energy-converting hydrogenase B subunit I
MMSPILKLFAFPCAFILVCFGVMTILGGHITPGGGFQGGAMIAAGVILCIIVYGVEKSPINFSHDFISAIESIGAMGYIILGLVGLFTTGFFLYNVGTDFYNILPQYIVNIFHYPDPTNAGIVPYFNILVGFKVFVGLSAVVIAFSQFDKIKEHVNDKEDETNTNDSKSNMDSKNTNGNKDSLNIGD